MTLQWHIRQFNELSLIQLYSVLRLRSEVFVVEQNCVYQDIDSKDAKARHIIGEFEGNIVAYARIFKPGDYFEKASIGRVVIDTRYRDRKWGHELMREAIAGIKKHFGATQITISAQLYLQNFYEQHEFVKMSEMYLEDNIPHIEMRRE